MNFLFYFSNVDFDSLKEASLGTERNAKNKSLSSNFTEEIKKNNQNVPKTSIFGENLNFLNFFLISSVTVLSKDLWFFCVASSAPRRFF